MWQVSGRVSTFFAQPLLMESTTSNSRRSMLSKANGKMGRKAWWWLCTSGRRCMNVVRTSISRKAGSTRSGA